MSRKLSREKAMELVFSMMLTKESHDEVIENCIFGDNNNHPRFNDFVGDYLVVATDNISLSYSKTHKHTKLTGGDHAGGLKEEAIIPLILYP